MIRQVVGFLIDVEEGDREILDCDTCTRPQPAACQVCPLYLGEQPECPRWLAFYLTLHKRVKRFNSLPDSGGILDQDEKTMRMLDMIEAVIEERSKKKGDQQRQEEESWRARAAAAGRRQR